MHIRKKWKKNMENKKQCPTDDHSKFRFVKQIRAHFYTRYSRMCALRGVTPGKCPGRVFRHCIPNKEL